MSMSRSPDSSSWPTTVRATTRLRRLVTRPEIAFLMEAHDGLSARIVEEAGFEGLWASGLTMSASFGVRDNNELSWSQVTDHVAFMTEASAIPVLVDGDTGYGNFNNMRRLVRKLEQVGAGGVTIEDKLFPKTNSFLRAERQPLARRPRAHEVLAHPDRGLPHAPRQRGGLGQPPAAGRDQRDAGHRPPGRRAG